MEKLNIEERKIIQILLKHLMVLKNENAFLKNNAALNADDIEMSENKIGGNMSNNSLPEIITGGKKPVDSLPEIITGGKKPVDSLAEIITGGKKPVDSLTEIVTGGKKPDSGLSEMVTGGKKFDSGLPEMVTGGKKAFEGISEIITGGKSVFKEIPNLNIDANGGALLYSVFEKGLLNALEDYIKNGAGRTTLYTFYADFVDAVEEQNSIATKIKEKTENAQLEDTHSLPQQIIIGDYSIARLSVALRKHVPRKIKNGLSHTIAIELLNLHNTGKATSAELRGFGTLSKDGFEKHLTNLIHNDFIKKQVPLNYVLTDKFNHILLELFGIPNNQIQK